MEESSNNAPKIKGLLEYKVKNQNNNEDSKSPGFAEKEVATKKNKTVLKNLLDPDSRVQRNVVFFSALLSLILALWSVVLTIKYGEQQEDLSELKDIAKSSRKTSDTLMSVLRTLNTQLENSNTANSLLQQTLISSSEIQSKTNTIALLQGNQSEMQYRYFLNSLGTIFPKNIEYKNWDSSRMMLFIQQISVLFESISSNPFILQNKDIIEKWSARLSDIRTMKAIMSSDLDYKNDAFQIMLENMFSFYWSNRKYFLKSTDNKLFEFIVEKNLKLAYLKLRFDFEVLYESFDDLEKEYLQHTEELYKDLYGVLDTMSSHNKSLLIEDFSKLKDSCNYILNLISNASKNPNETLEILAYSELPNFMQKVLRSNLSVKRRQKSKSNDYIDRENQDLLKRLQTLVVPRLRKLMKWIDALIEIIKKYPTTNVFLYLYNKMMIPL